MNQNIEGSPLYQSPKNKFANGNGLAGAVGHLHLTDKTIYQPFDNDAALRCRPTARRRPIIWNDAQKRYC